MASEATGAADTAPLALFPLKQVLMPGALLALRVFEARYLDLVSRCMRSGEPFGIINLRQGAEAGAGQGAVELESVGTLAHIDDVDAEQNGILHLRCHGGQRFRCVDTPTQSGNGLWTANVRVLPADPLRAPGAAMNPTVQALEDAIQQLQKLDQHPFELPPRLDDAGWVANRWCELLPIDRSAKQKLMELSDPMIRLSLVDGYLRDKKIIVG
jgi:uncharacterized protein